MKKTKSGSAQQLDLFGNTNIQENGNTQESNGRSNGESVLSESRRGDTGANLVESDAVYSSGAVPADDGRAARSGGREDEKPGSLFGGDGEIGTGIYSGGRPLYPEWDGLSRGNGRIEAVRSSEVELVNFHRTQDEREARPTFNKAEALENNLAAMRLVLILRSQARQASEAEQVVLSKYVGFGGLSEILFDPAEADSWTRSKTTNLRGYFQEVHALIGELDTDGTLLDKVKSSVMNAHYTPYYIINALHESLRNTGFNGGRILEPSAGIGNFLSALPVDVSEQSDVTAIELEPLTGTILSYLYPTADIQVRGFEDARIPDGYFDLTIGNVPFGDYGVVDRDLKYSGDDYAALSDASIHNYFFAKSILHAKENGVIALVTSRYTLDAKDSKVRQLMAAKCEFLGAIRLPNNTFKGSAGATVVSDIIFLRKKEEKEEIKHKTDFINVKGERVLRKDNRTVEVQYNGYFHENKTHLLGKIEPGGKFADNDFDLVATQSEAELAGSIRDIATKILTGVTYSKSMSKVMAERDRRYVEMNNFLQPGNVVLYPDGFAGVITGATYVDEKLDLKAKSIGLNPNLLRDVNHFPSSEEIQKLETLGLLVSDFQNKEVASFRYSKEKAPFEALRLSIKLRNTLKELLVYETANESPERIEAKRQELNRDYERFVARYQNLGGVKGSYIKTLDVDGQLLSTLEVKQVLANGKTEIRKADIFTQRINTPVVYPSKVETIEEAIVVCMNEEGRLNQNKICELLNTTLTDLITLERSKAEPKLFWDEKGRIFERDEYLSGEVVAKLEGIKKAMVENSDLRVNYNQLLLVQPLPIAVENIYSPVEARWVPLDIVQEFAREALKESSVVVSYKKRTDERSVSGSSSSASGLGTALRPASWVLEHALNGTEPLVKTTKTEPDGKKIEVLEVDDTRFAKQQVIAIKELWETFKLANKERRLVLETLYNSTYNTTVVREKYDGSSYVMKGYYGPKLRPHQLDTVYRNIVQCGGLNDHGVGSGKTLIQVCVANEAKRLGVANKPMIVGMKAQLPDMYNAYRQCYPTAKLLYPKEKDFEKTNRSVLLNSIATNNWDCVILTHEQFAKIRQPIEYHKRYIDERLGEIEAMVNDSDKPDKARLKQLEREKRKLLTKLDKLLSEEHKDRNVLNFKQLGIDFLVVDESHEFKNLEFTTKKNNIRGLGNTSGSARASNMKIACTLIQEKRGGDKGILFSSGTPICNTMGEMYLLKKYLRPSKLERMGLNNFDQWASIFTVNSAELEFYLGSFKSVNRMRQFVNVPELMTFYKEFTDVKNDFNVKIEKPVGVSELVMVEPTEGQRAYLPMLNAFLATKGKDFRHELGLTNGYIPERNMNPSFAIMVQTFARKLALDPRLVDKYAEPGLKIQKAADMIYDRYIETKEHKGTQLVFCDLGTPKAKDEYGTFYNALEEDNNLTETDLKYIFSNKNIEDVKARIKETLQLDENDFKDFEAAVKSYDKFSVYDELKTLLVAKGMPSDQIDFIHNYNKADEKEALYKRMNNGDLALLMGSTKKLGTGVNVQQRVVGMWHLDVPYRPDYLEQRNGRGTRQGNTLTRDVYGNKLPIKYFGTKETFDASMYELVSSKAAFIQSIKVNRDPSIRTMKDADEEIDLKMMGALLSGNPLHKEKEDIRQRLEELASLKNSFLSQAFAAERRIEDNEKLARGYEKRIASLKEALPYLDKIQLGAEGTPILVASVMGRPCETIKELGTNLLGEVNILINTKRPFQEKTIANVFGFEITASRATDNVGVKRTIRSPLNGVIEQNYFPETEMANGLQVRNAIMAIPQEIGVKEGQVTELQKTNTALRETANKLFPYDNDIMTLKMREIQVIDEIEKSTREKALEIDKDQTTLDIKPDDSKNVIKINPKLNTNDNDNSVGMGM
jgi:N12 class adenine-specific DNA methylase